MDTLNNILQIPKFDQLKCFLHGKVDMFVLTGSKVGSSFPTNQFLIGGYSKPFRFDRNRSGGGVFIDQGRYIMQRTRTS